MKQSYIKAYLSRFYEKNKSKKTTRNLELKIKKLHHKKRWQAFSKCLPPYYLSYKIL
jgi:hypothetical protein